MYRPDYRNRPPVDAPRPTVWRILKDTPARRTAEVAATFVGIPVIGFFYAILFGLVR